MSSYKILNDNEIEVTVVISKSNADQYKKMLLLATNINTVRCSLSPKQTNVFYMRLSRGVTKLFETFVLINDTNNKNGYWGNLKKIEITTDYAVLTFHFLKNLVLSNTI